MPMAREQMLEYITAYESGANVLLEFDAGIDTDADGRVGHTTSVLKVRNPLDVLGTGPKFPGDGVALAIGERPVHTQLEERLRMKGYEVLSWSEAGWVHFFAKEPVRTPDDLRRLRLWIATGDPLLFRGAGAGAGSGLQAAGGPALSRPSSSRLRPHPPPSSEPGCARPA